MNLICRCVFQIRMMFFLNNPRKIPQAFQINQLETKHLIHFVSAHLVLITLLVNICFWLFTTLELHNISICHQYILIAVFWMNLILYFTCIVRYLLLILIPFLQNTRRWTVLEILLHKISLFFLSLGVSSVKKKPMLSKETSYHARDSVRKSLAVDVEFQQAKVTALLEKIKSLGMFIYLSLDKKFRF